MGGMLPSPLPLSLLSLHTLDSSLSLPTNLTLMLFYTYLQVCLPVLLLPRPGLLM